MTLLCPQFAATSCFLEGWKPKFSGDRQDQFGILAVVTAGKAVDLNCRKISCDRVWDVRTKSVVRNLETKSPCTSVEVSRDGCFITTADGNTVKFWDANQ